MLFTAFFSPKTPSILSTASISNVRPPGICSCQAERGAAWDWPWPAHQEDTVTDKQAMLGARGDRSIKGREKCMTLDFRCYEKNKELNLNCMVFCDKTTSDKICRASFNP